MNFFYFLEYYNIKIVIIDEFFKKMFYFKIIFFIFFYYKYIDKQKITVKILSRIYRNLRLNYIVDNLQIDYKKIFIFKKQKKKAKLFLFMTFFYSKNFFFFFEFFLIKIFRFLKKYKLSLYGLILRNGIFFCWYDLYSFIRVIDEVLIYRSSFFFKYDLPHIIFYIYLYYYINFYKFNFLKFFQYYGFFFFYRKKKFKYKFYTRII